MTDKKQLDLEHHQKMRAMETSKRAESLKDAKVTIITQNSDGETIDFDTWWMDINRRIDLHPWMKEVLAVDFISRGLSKEESIQRFDDTLRIFGFKF